MTSVRTLALIALAAPVAASAQTLPLLVTYNLPSQLERQSSNYHPQGLGVNEETGELLYAQQASNTISIGNRTGAWLRDVGSIRNYTTSVAYHDGRFYFSDYQGNASTQDMWSMRASDGGNLVEYGSDVAAYGGFPMDIRDGLLYRTELSGSYSYSNLNEIWVSNVATPNSRIRSMSLPVPSGIGDIAVDPDRNAIFILDYNANAAIRRYNLQTGALVESYQVVGDGLDAGITVYQDRLYYWDWVNGNSTLSVFSLTPIDSDNDGVLEGDDNCPLVANPNQEDGDGDGVGDVCDDCPLDANDDSDGDGVCDSQDACPGSDDQADADSDGVPDDCDICVQGNDYLDADDDGTPDACDVCPQDALNDRDGDGFCDSDDNCLTVPNSVQADYDSDGVGDACDECPLDSPNDTDGDSVCDSQDQCPQGDDAADADGDSVPDACDECPNGDDNADADGDGVADACDVCPQDRGDDFDNDGVCNSVDNCVGNPNPNQLDTDEDGVGDICDRCPLDATGDSDGDGLCDSVDPYPDVPNGQDADGDGVPDPLDQCPGGDDDADYDLDGLADACDDCPLDPQGADDDDGDGICNSEDDCTGVGSVDSDRDGICDTIDLCDGFDDSGDADGDGICALDVNGLSVLDCDDDNADVYPGAPELCDGVDNACTGRVPNEDIDADGDGASICDGDCDDSDALVGPDAIEVCNGFDDDCDGVVPADEADADGDGMAVCDGDCNDGNSLVRPGAVEVCDTLDNDCDGSVDEECLGGDTEPDTDADTDMDTDTDDDSEVVVDIGPERNCGCSSTPSSMGWLLLLGPIVMGVRRRRG